MATTTPQTQTLYGISETANRLGITADWARELVRRGELTPNFREARTDASLFLASAVERLQKERRKAKRSARRNGHGRVNGNGHHGG